MTTITLPRAVVEQALEALEGAEDHLAKPYSTDASKAVVALRAALAQQAERVEPVGRVVSANCEYATVQWLKQTSDVGGGDPKNSRSWPIAGDAVYTAPPQQAEPVASLNAWAADRLARHGIPMPETPRCTDCWGIGYDASGQLCACQQNPSFG